MSILEIRMWDSVTDDIPARVAAKAGYVAGLFPTWNEAWFKKIVADHALSIAIHAGEVADVLDIESGDAVIADAPGFLEARKALGRKAIFYHSLSGVMDLIHLLDSHGYKFGEDYYIWSAHYTGVPHICSPACNTPINFGLDRVLHATQYTDHANGKNLDESLVNAVIFDLSRAPAHPEYEVLDPTLRKLHGASLRRVSELGRIKTYDRMKAGYDRKFVENDCLLLFNRLWDVVHEHGKLAVNSPKAKHNWTLNHRGERARSS